MKKINFFLSLLFLGILSFAQKHVEPTQGLDFPIGKEGEKCKHCKELLLNMPQDVQYQVQRENNDLYFIIDNAEWFSRLFNSKDDGIAVDIVRRSQFDCKGENKYSGNFVSLGRLTPPIYQKTIMENAKTSSQNQIWVKVGTIPDDLRNEDMEYNIVFLKGKYRCDYKNVYNIQAQGWDLLEMGLYMDTITEKAEVAEKVIMLNKKWEFTVPFEKNKFQYEAKDMKPIYDSLKLNDYDIKNIEIRAFSSVEGPSELNIQLQEKRAKSIVNALQSFQYDSIATKINASENWVEFFNDIAGTKYQGMGALSKQDVKTQLTKQRADEMEPILKKHRKAILSIELEKKSTSKETNATKITNFYNQAIAQNKTREALELQHQLFNKIKDHQFPDSLINKLEIPNKAEFTALAFNRTAFKFSLNNTQESQLQALEQFQKLLVLLPDNARLRYNIIALKLYYWNTTHKLTGSPEALRAEIASLEKAGINKSLVKRMLVNYYMIMSEFYAKKNDYENKDKCLGVIRSYYKNAELPQKDIYRLALYFVNFTKYSWALESMYPYITKINVDEDILFLNLNLTIGNDFYTQNPQYRKILLNAYNVNKERFCKMFTNNQKGGISFQLLKDQYLKKTYCESCQ